MQLCLALCLVTLIMISDFLLKKADKIGCGGRDMNNVTLYKVQCEQGEKAQSELGIHVGWIVSLLVRQ